MKIKRRTWRCFHCDEVFLTIAAAREHFGPHELADPACQIDIAKFREMEHYHARCLAEDSDSEQAWHARSADHVRALGNEEQKGFDRGLRAQLEKIAHDKTCPYCERAGRLGSMLEPPEKDSPMPPDPIIFTLWFCLATQPTCEPAQDPTGPKPVTKEFASLPTCEAYYAWGEVHIPTPQGLITRHTCKPAGDNI